MYNYNCRYWIQGSVAVRLIPDFLMWILPALYPPPPSPPCKVFVGGILFSCPCVCLSSLPSVTFWSLRGEGGRCWGEGGCINKHCSFLLNLETSVIAFEDILLQIGVSVKIQTRMANSVGPWCDGLLWAISSGSALLAKVSVLVCRAKKCELLLCRKFIVW